MDDGAGSVREGPAERWVRWGLAATAQSWKNWDRVGMEVLGSRYKSEKLETDKELNSPAEAEKQSVSQLRQGSERG